jgi:spore coat protein U-like protein
MLRNRKTFFVACIALTSLLAIAQTTPVLTSTAVMPVRMEIVAACRVSVSDLDFGAYTPTLKSPVLGQTTIQILCAPGTTAEIALDPGLSPGNNTARRKLLQESGNDRLDYDLFQDAARTIHWGDRSGRDTLEVVTADATHTVNVYGEIPAGQRARDGTYSDVITVTVNY